MVKDEPRVIQADFVSFRSIQGRKVLQLVLETDITNTVEVMTKLGAPNHGESVSVAVALLNKELAQEQTSPAVVSNSGANGKHEGLDNAPATKRKFSELPLSQQAGIRCAEPQFWRYLGVGSEASAKAQVRIRCGVESRSQLDSEQRPARTWGDIEDGYQKFLTDQRYGEVARRG